MSPHGLPSVCLCPEPLLLIRTAVLSQGPTPATSSSSPPPRPPMSRYSYVGGCWALGLPLVKFVGTEFSLSPCLQVINRHFFPLARAGEDSGACGHRANARGHLQRRGRVSVFGVSVAAARSEASTPWALPGSACLPVGGHVASVLCAIFRFKKESPWFALKSCHLERKWSCSLVG